MQMASRHKDVASADRDSGPDQSWEAQIRDVFRRQALSVAARHWHPGYLNRNNYLLRRLARLAVEVEVLRDAVYVVIGNVASGHSFCNPSDTFDKRIGLCLAVNRALHSWFALQAIKEIKSCK